MTEQTKPTQDTTTGPNGAGAQTAAGAQLIIQLVQQWRACRQIELGDFCIADAVQVFDQRAQAVAVRGHEHALAAYESARDRTLPIREQALERILQGLRARNLVRLQACVTPIVAEPISP